MKRGNTALKRGVGLASAFALAIAGAVIAAPAANAFSGAGQTPTTPVINDIVRATPDADATYATDGTGDAPRLEIGEDDQAASGFQIKLPIEWSGTTQNATWHPGDRFKVTLPLGVTWASAPTVSSTGAVDLTGLATKAGYKQSSPAATELDAVKVTPKIGSNTLQAPAIEATVSGGTLYLQITNNQYGFQPGDPDYAANTFTTADAGYAKTAVGTDNVSTGDVGFLVSVSDVKLSVASSAFSGPVGATVVGQNATNYPQSTVTYADADNAGAHVVGGTTTIGWLNGAKVTVDEGVLDADDAAQPIPTITVTEAIAAGLVNATGSEKYSLYGEVASKTDSGYVVFEQVKGQGTALDAAYTSEDGLVAKNFDRNTTNTAVVFNLEGTSTAKKQAIALENLRVAGFVTCYADVAETTTQACDGTEDHASAVKPLPQSAKVTFVLDATNVTDHRQNALNLTAASAISAFSYSPDGLTYFVASPDVTVGAITDRIAGPDRFETARRIALQLADTNGNGTIESSERVNAIIVANGETAKGGYDALAANYLAKQLGAPILLTNANSVPKATAAAIRQIADDDTVIYVMGKTDSVSQAVRTQLGNTASLLFTNAVLEVAGGNRYATAALAASYKGTASAYTFSYGKTKLRTAFLASGESNADALAVGPLAIAANVPVLLTGKARLAPQTADAIVSMGIQQVVILGGTDRITEATEKALADLGVKNVVRLAGSDRYETAAKIYDLAFLSAPNPTQKDGGFGVTQGDTVYLANGQAGFPDALTIGPLAGRSHSALLTVSDAATLPESTSTFLGNKDLDAISAIAVGGVDRIKQSALDAANKLLG